MGSEARDVPSQPLLLPGVRLDVDALVAEIERRNEKLGGFLGSAEEASLHLEAVRKRARKAGEACDQSYLQVKATLEAVCRLGDPSVAVSKYGPPSLRRLQRSKKRKKGRAVAEQVPEDMATQSDSLAVGHAVPVEESDLQTGIGPVAVEQSDLENGTVHRWESSLALGRERWDRGRLARPRPTGSGRSPRLFAFLAMSFLLEGFRGRPVPEGRLRTRVSLKPEKR